MNTWALAPGDHPDRLILACDTAQQRGDSLLLLNLSEQGMLRYPNEIGFRQRQAQALIALERWSAASNVLQYLLRLQPNEADWWMSLAHCQRELGQHDKLSHTLAIAHAATAASPDRSIICRPYP